MSNLLSATLPSFLLVKHTFYSNNPFLPSKNTHFINYHSANVMSFAKTTTVSRYITFTTLDTKSFSISVRSSPRGMMSRTLSHLPTQKANHKLNPLMSDFQQMSEYKKTQNTNGYTQSSDTNE